DPFPGKHSSYPANLTLLNGKIYFSAKDAQYSSPLWVTDGTARGTHAVKNVGQYREPDDIHNIGGRLFFGTYDGLWPSDVTSAGTTLIKRGAFRLADDCYYGCDYFPITDLNGIAIFPLHSYSKWGTEMW